MYSFLKAFLVLMKLKSIPVLCEKRVWSKKTWPRKDWASSIPFGKLQLNLKLLNVGMKGLQHLHIINVYKRISKYF